MAQANVKLTVDATSATRALSNVQRQTNTLQKSFGGLKTAIAGGMALMGIPVIPSAMAYDARRASYESYAKNFAKAQSSASFTARVNTGSGTNVNDSAMETANTNEQDSASTNYRTDAERKLALSRNAEALKASRKFFNSSNQLITGSMV